MIIPALVQRYEDKPAAPLGWQVREVSYALDISKNGDLLDVILLEWEREISTAKKKTKEMAKRKMILPLEFGRSGKNAFETANFLCDDGSYMLGLDPRKFESARKFHSKLLKNVNIDAAQAIIAYFNAGIPTFPDKKLDGKTAVEVKFVFFFNGKSVDEYEAIRESWNRYYTNSSETQVRCLVTGKMDTPLYSHNVIHLRGGQSSGSRLISANAESFASYGKTMKERAADVGKYAAFAYVTALADLIKSRDNSISIGGDTLAYWAEKGGEAEEQAFSWIADPKQDDSSKLKAVMDKVAKGDIVHIERFDPEHKFFLLCLSPAAARITVRFFHTDSFGKIVSNIMRHYKNLEIIGDNRTKFDFIPLWLILGETTVKGSAGDSAPLLGGQLLRAILTDTIYPMTLYNAILCRIRAGGDISKTKAAVIKAVLIRNFGESEVTSMALNEQTDNKPYVLGRLFAALEKLQKDASGGGLNATIRDRFFASACANPGSIFPTLLRLSMHHSAKLDNAVYFEKLKGGLLDKLDVEAPFPSSLSLEEQGIFILGYYHQTQSFYTPKKEKEEADETNA